MENTREIASIVLKTIEHENENVTSLKMNGQTDKITDLLIDALGELLARALKPDIDINEAMDGLSRDVLRSVLKAREENLNA